MEFSIDFEKIISWVIILGIIVFIAFRPIFRTSSIFKPLVDFAKGKPLWIHNNWFFRKLNYNDEVLLNNHVPFYFNLSNEQKLVFANRVLRFMDDKVFRIDPAISNKQLVKLLISASSIKVTFGLQTYLFPSFHTIVVRPESYYSRFTRSTNKGETSGAGFIVFSWKDFIFGIKDETDSYNLGYHEFAHALHIEQMKQSMEPDFSKNFNQWQNYVEDQSTEKELRENNFFRNYAYTNIQEFFAVSVENFFEKPAQFSKELPQLYYLMKKMMNQDPLSITKS